MCFIEQLEPINTKSLETLPSGKKIIILNSHPIQYFAPLYKKMTEEGLNVEVWYGSDESIKGTRDKQFGVHVKWDIPLLEGYKYCFFKNHSWKPSIHNGFFGLMNLSLATAIRKEPKSLVIVHGWSYLSSILLLLSAKIFGHQVGLRGESPLNQELLKSKKKRLLKKIFLKYFLFRFVDTFFYIGQQNRKFYQYYGVKEEQLVFTPFSVDNDRFQQAAKELLPRKKHLRKELGLPVEAKIILYSGKYIYKKRPMDLLQAYALLDIPEKALVMVGEGEMRPQMEKFIAEHKLQNVFLKGFVNQSEIVKYYAIADVFVMCSGPGETWGLSTNEAMNFGLPVVLSDMVGCREDLIPEKFADKYTFILGNMSSMASALHKGMKNTESFSPEDTLALINKYSYNTIVGNFKSIPA